MYTALCYSKGKLRRVADLEEISELIAQPDQLVWLDLKSPSEQELEMLEREFRFHKLAMEDVRRGHQRPKIDQYEGYCFVVMYSVSYMRTRKRGESGLHPSEIGIFMGRNYVVTVHRAPVPEIEEVIRRWEENPDMVSDANNGFLLYTICDSIVDNYFPVIDAIGEVIDKLEEKMFVIFRQEAIGDIFMLRKDLLSLRRLVGPERDVFNALTRRDLPILTGANAVYFADVYDHLLRVGDTIDTYHDLLSGVLEGYLSIISNNLNQIMKILTSGSIILMSMSLVASIYGMNFRNMPELDWPFGYAYALGLMAIIAIILFLLFRRRTWI